MFMHQLNVLNFEERARFAFYAGYFQLQADHVV